MTIPLYRTILRHYHSAYTSARLIIPNHLELRHSPINPLTIQHNNLILQHNLLPFMGDSIHKMVVARGSEWWTRQINAAKVKSGVDRHHDICRLPSVLHMRLAIAPVHISPMSVDKCHNSKARCLSTLRSFHLLQ
jgi:hypothetical protein